jgi:hypothetical protein
MKHLKGKSLFSFNKGSLLRSTEEQISIGKEITSNTARDYSYQTCLSVPTSPPSFVSREAAQS